MLKQALRQLLSDLQRAPDRSKYEQALFDELSALAKLTPPAGFEGPSWGAPKDFEINIKAPQTKIDLVESDIQRLRCGEGNCPNKRL